MNMIDTESKTRVRVLQLYLTPDEANFFCKELDRLLADSEANGHSHVDLGTGSEISVSILTPNKLKNMERHQNRA